LEPTALTGASVLIVDPCLESREVLRTVLERRGVQIYEASEGRRGLELARRHHPGVIVMDMETVPPSDAETRAGYGAESRAHHSSLVMLASARRDTAGLPDGRVVPKPYHYGPLIRTIEELLQSSAPVDRHGG
jgi:DNA-binding response OmpR family regulator